MNEKMNRYVRPFPEKGCVPGTNSNVLRLCSPIKHNDSWTTFDSGAIPWKVCLPTSLREPRIAREVF